MFPLKTLHLLQRMPDQGMLAKMDNTDNHQLFLCMSKLCWRHDTQHNDIQHKHSQHNDIQHCYAATQGTKAS
jgi:hypothetical protein